MVSNTDIPHWLPSLAEIVAEQYKEWFYVNIHTKKSQWEKPTEPVYPPPGENEEPDGLPPYDPKNARAVGPEKSSLGSNNPFGQSGAGSSGAPDTVSDEELARKLQAEENAHRPGGSRGEADNYFNDGHSGQGGHASPNNDLPPRPEQQKRGLFGKLLGKTKMLSSQQQQQQYYPPPQQPYYPHGPPQGVPYGYPPPGGYYPPPGGPGGYYGGGYHKPQRKGLGKGGAAALGLGGGLLGGMLIGQAASDGGGWGGDDYGGDDYGGGGGFDGGGE
jgi:hypothetical protein